MAKKKVICGCGSELPGYMFQGVLRCDKCLYPGRPLDGSGDVLPELPDSEYHEIAEAYFLSGGRSSSVLSRTGEMADSVDNASAKKLGDALQKKIYELGFEKPRKYSAWPFHNRGGNDGE